MLSLHEGHVVLSYRGKKEEFTVRSKVRGRACVCVCALCGSFEILRLGEFFEKSPVQSAIRRVSVNSIEVDERFYGILS